MRVSVRRFAFVGVVIALFALPAAAGAVGGFASPLFGLATAPNGDILVADAGAGVTAIDGDTVGSTISLPGVSDVSPIGRGSMWATTGAGEDAEADTGQALHRVSNGTVRQIANLFAFEEANDPDGAGVDSNPFDVQSLGGSAALVADSGGNDLLRVDNRGNVDVLAIFPDELVSTANARALIGCPNEDPELGFLCEIDELPAQAVPTSIAVGADGYYYVGELKGFPAPADESNIWRVAAGASWADCGVSPDCVKAFDGGFTSIIDLAFGPDGNLYVAELDELSWAALELGIGGVGGTISSCDVALSTCDVVAAGIPMLTAITFGADGSLWATQNALIPGAAEVIEIP
ncbi:MAG: ScyD/ScyE family protein [Acidimicrobiia bacterium]|nr:ScyD/ScyE family protein [Acidimicrobiia bacterium]